VAIDFARGSRFSLARYLLEEHTHMLVASPCRFVLLVAATSVVSASGFAQPASFGRGLVSMTLPEAIVYAHEHHPRLRSALAELKARQAETRVPRAQWLPQLGATAQIFYGSFNNTVNSFINVPELDLPRIGGRTASANTDWTPYGSTLAALGVTQEVYDFGRIAAQIAVADALAALAHADAQSIDLDIDLGVEEAYHGALAAKEVLHATDEALKRAVTHRDYAQAGTRSGMRPPIDLTRAQADVATLEVRRIRAVAGLDAARAALAAALGAEAPQIDAAPIAPDQTPAPAFDQALRIAATRNPAIAAALARLRAQEFATKELFREMLPNLFASAGLNGRAGGAPPPAGMSSPTGDGWLPDVGNWHLGLVLQWNLFDGTVLARRDVARAREEAAQADLDLQRMMVGLGTEKAWLDLDAALKALPGLTQAVDAARANWQQADARFRAGLGTVVELADAEGLLTSSMLELAIGHFTVARTRAGLARVMGQATSGKRP
jgi:outer membrane protein TolC